MRTLPALLAIGAIAALSACSSVSSGERWERLPAHEIVDQRTYSDMACGPAALATSLLLEGGRARSAVRSDGNDVLARAIDTYGAAPSEAYGDVPRFSPTSGVCPTDLLAWANQWRGDLDLDAREGIWLDRAGAESDDAFCRRIHRALADSIAADAAPLVRLRSFVTNWYAGRNEYLWDGVAAHWIVVVGVPAALPEGALGFPFEYADPATARVARGFVSTERERPFVAAKGDERRWEWLAGSPFLVAVLPQLTVLGRAQETWYLRDVVTFDHAILELGD